MDNAKFLNIGFLKVEKKQSKDWFDLIPTRMEHLLRRPDNRPTEKSKGIIINEKVKVTSISFADDIHPISTSKEDFQNQLNIIETFLKVHGMKMNASKSQINHKF